MTKSFNFFLVLFVFTSIHLLAQMPPHPDLLKKISRGEIDMPYMLKHLHELREQGIDAPSPTSILNVLEEKRQKSGGKNPESVTYNVLAVCVDFTDRPFNTDPVYFDNLFNSTTKSNSLFNYLKEATYGKILVSTPKKPSEIGKILANKTYAYYCGSTHGAYVAELVSEIVAKIDPIVDYSKYDNNGDGKVDCLFIIHSGPGAERSGSNYDIWSHASGISAQYRDGVYISNYSTEPEYWDKPGDMTVGVYAHEMGHAAFGLPDLYDINADNGGSNGLGSWSIMAGGSWNGTNGDTPAHFDGWSKLRMGALTAVNLADDTLGIEFKNVEENQAVYKVWKDGVPGKEYFLLENRQQQGFDTRIPGRGLLIYHIDENQSTNGNQWYPGHTSNGHYLVALEQADGLWDLEKGVNNGDSKDPFPGSLNQHSFDFGTTPNSKNYSNSFTNVSITDIKSSLNVVTADVILSDALYLSSSSLDLGSVEVDAAEVDSILTLKNTGTLPINIADIKNNNPLIKIKSPVTFPLDLLKNESLILKISFDPISKGVATDTILITYTGKRSSVKTVPVTAFGFVVKPISDSLIYCSTKQGAIITVNPVTNSAAVLGKTGFPRVKSLALSRKNMMLLGLGITSAETDLIKINGAEGDGYKVLKLSKPITSITLDTNNVLYGMTDFSGVFKINMSTGVCDSIGSTGLSSSSILGGLAVNPLTNQLFASVSAGTLNLDAIYSIDAATGKATLVGNTGFKTFTSSLAFDNTGKLFGFKCSSTGTGNLIKINPLTGVGVLLNSNSFSSIEGLAVNVTGILTGINDNKNGMVVNSFSLEQNFPNPFNPTTSIGYSIPKHSQVKLVVYDMLGREVATLVNETKNSGTYKADFDASKLSSGIYIYTLTSQDQILSRKMILIK